MKKTTAGFAVAAAAGLVALSATPAAAAHLPFPNCDAAAALGVYNIPAGTPGYALHLDADRDGSGCDAAGTPAYNPALLGEHMQPTPSPAPPMGNQVTQMPMGGAATGVEVTQTDNTAALALGGGLVLALAAGGTYVVRRRAA
ncbi:hypothetical protein GCM10009784_26020 [Arthrobacter parietis]|uniref:Excalibur calcium-binding domain-containing protein n=2 Tax=Arthrobacter TaxID=1663 RepID=A0ABT6CZA6_9MICC|nr:excalibur calcium-binding domain-containing protein [Arthrobacter vasquezii]MDF9279438.1 excalibur calcium-binding domain-containing protein [Arthrobacter vasquezii]